MKYIPTALKSVDRLSILTNVALLGALAHQYGFLGPVLGIFVLIGYRHIVDELQPEVTIRYNQPNALDNSKSFLDRIRIPKIDAPLAVGLVLLSGIALFLGMVSAILLSLVINIGAYTIPLFIFALIVITISGILEVKYKKNATFEDIIEVKKHVHRSSLKIPEKIKTEDITIAPNNGSYIDWKDVEEATLDEDDTFISFQTFEFDDPEKQQSGLCANTEYGDNNASYQLPVENLVVYDTYANTLATLDADTIR